MKYSVTGCFPTWLVDISSGLGEFAGYLVDLFSSAISVWLPCVVLYSSDPCGIGTSQIVLVSTQWLHLNWLHLLPDYFQINSDSEVLRAHVVHCEFREGIVDLVLRWSQVLPTDALFLTWSAPLPTFILFKSHLLVKSVYEVCSNIISQITHLVPALALDSNENWGRLLGIVWLHRPPQWIDICESTWEDRLCEWGILAKKIVSGRPKSLDMKPGNLTWSAFVVSQVSWTHRMENAPH